MKVHPYVDALANLLSAAEAMEDALFRALAVVDKAADGAETDGAKPHPETPSAKPRARKNGQKRASAAVAAASAAQDWRLRLEALAASTPARATRYDANGAPPDAAATQSLATTYALTRDAFSSAADAAAAARAGDARAPEDVDESRTPSRAWEVWRQASDAMDAALGVPSGKPAEPLLWRAAGHPTTPRTEPLRRAEEDVRAMCAALRPGTSAGAAAAAAAAKAIRDGRTDAANAIDSAKNAAAAAVGTPAGAALRAAALEGLCFFAWTRAEDDARVENGNGNGNQLALGNGDGGAFSTGARAADADAAAFLEREAGSIPARLAAECRVVAAAAKVSETKGAGEETAKDVGADGSSAGADGSSAAIADSIAIAGSSASEPVPPEYSLPATNLLRSLDALERPGRSVPPLGFPAWSLRWPAAAAAHASLMPLLELHSVATQPALLAKLTRRVALRAAEEVSRKTGRTNEEKETEEDEHLQTFQNVSDPDDAEAVSAIVEAASSGMAFGVAAAPRDPSDFAAHRHVLWLLADDPSANGTRRRRASAEASLPALAGSAWRSWHASCWGGAGETMPLAHAPRAFRKRRVVGEAPKDDATFESDVAACHAASRWRAAEGPRRREVALATGIATALVGEGCGATGVAARAIRTAQLRLAARALRLRTPSSRAASAAEWASIGALVAQILVAHAPAAGNRGGRVTLARAAADLVAWCDVEGGHVSAEGVKRGGESARELRERLSAACGATTHGPFRALLADVIGPLVETTIAGAADAAMMDAAMMDAAMMDAAMDDARAFADVDAAASRARDGRAGIAREEARRGPSWDWRGCICFSRGNARSRGGDGDATRARKNTIGGRDASRARRARVAASNPRRDASAESRDDVDDFRIVRARRRGAIFIRARRAETDAADVATDARGDDEIPNDVRVGGSRRRFDSRARARRRHSAGRRAREGGGGGVARRRRTVGRTPRRRFQGVRGRDGTREIGGVGAPTRRHAVDARRAGPRGDRGCGARGEGEGDARARRSGGGGGGGAPSQFPAVIAHAPSGREQKFLPRVHGGAPRLPRHATRVIRRGDGGAHARRGVSTRGGRRGARPAARRRRRRRRNFASRRFAPRSPPPKRRRSRAAR